MINLARMFWNGPRGIKSLSENKRKRKSLVSGTVDGPPMFMNTMAVPFLPERVTLDVEKFRKECLSMSGYL